jgi:hypothetical protein
LHGAHAATACFRCHEGAQVGNFQRETTRCEHCHQQDLARADSPDHAGNGWTRDCQECHQPTAWRDARFRHPTGIDGGDHRSLGCNDCHTTPGSSRQFSCVHCHDHDRAVMADEHEDVRGYGWNSPACFRCHPAGRK